MLLNERGAKPVFGSDILTVKWLWWSYLILSIMQDFFFFFFYKLNNHFIEKK
jgi:hypothetical protein